MPRAYLTTPGNNAVQYWPRPDDWNPNDNTVEVIGAGFLGGIQGFAPRMAPHEAGAPAPRAITYGGGGGGGGAYAKGVNLDPTFPVPCIIASGSSYGSAGYHSGFNITTPTPTYAPGMVVARNGDPAGSYSGLGGQGGPAFYPTGFKGGNGGNAPNQSDGKGAGGGGAGGPNGAGSNGGNSTSAAGGTGGAADGGTVAGSAAREDGRSGQEWDMSHGCGAGGGGLTGGVPVQGLTGLGGKYGGGGGGSTSGTNQPGSGGDALIIITWTSLPPVPRALILT